MREPMNLSPEGRDGRFGGVLCDCAASERKLPFDDFRSFCHHSNLCWFRNLFHGRIADAPLSSQKNFFKFFIVRRLSKKIEKNPAPLFLLLRLFF